MELSRAYSTLEIKAATDSSGKRTFSGIASTISTDRGGDIMEPKGAQFKLPMPLLWMHDAKQPVGWVTSANVTDKGIEINGEIASTQEDGTLKQKLDEAWQMLKIGLVRGLSIGFNEIDAVRNEGTRGYRYLKWSWLELSCVTIPMNQGASITQIKSVDTAMLAASGRGRGVASSVSPGASGCSKSTASRGNSTGNKGNNMKTLQDLRTEREQKMARIGELVETAKSNDGQMGTDAETEFDSLELEVKQLDGDIRKARFDYLNSGSAITVDGKSSASASQSRGPAIIVKKESDEKFQGQNYTRLIIAKALAHMHLMQGNFISASSIAQKRWGKENENLVRLLKTNEIAGGGSGSGEWGAELVQADTRYTGDFITYLTSRTVYDKLPLRQVPANVAIKGQDGTATGYWVGQSKPIPASVQDFSTVSLTPLKVAALAVISNELLRDSTPAAEMLIRDALVDASAQRIDTTFLSAAAAVSNVSPAGILNGVSAGVSAGADQAGVFADIKALYRSFILAKHVNNLQFVAHPSQAKAIGLLQNALGLDAFPGLNASGGMLRGDKVVTGDNVGGSDLILLDPAEIYRIGDTGITVEMSREATIEQSTAPTGATDTPVAATQYMTNMFQAESTAIKVVRSINFAKRRSTAVAYIRNVDYDGVES